MNAYRNIMEEIVLQHVDHVLEECHCCPCNVCRTDVITYALNRLPPKYVSTFKGELLASIDSHVAQNATDIIFVLTQGAMQIKDHPSHPQPLSD